MAVAGGTLLLAVNGRLTSYDDRTGQIQWTATPRPTSLGASPGELSLQPALMSRTTARCEVYESAALPIIGER